MSITGLSDGELLISNSGEWINQTPAEANLSVLGHTHVEADITDLDKYTQDETDNLLDGKSNVGHTHILADITDYESGGDLYLNDLLDVNAPSPSDRDVLTWDEDTEEWISKPPNPLQLRTTVAGHPPLLIISDGAVVLDDYYDFISVYPEGGAYDVLENISGDAIPGQLLYLVCSTNTLDGILLKHNAEASGRMFLINDRDILLRPGEIVAFVRLTGSWWQTGYGNDLYMEHDAVKLQGRDVAADAPAGGDVLTWDSDASEWVPAAATDGAAIHDNEAGEIAGITEKEAPVAGDLLLIEDSEDGYAKKRVEIGNLPVAETVPGDFHVDGALEVDGAVEVGGPLVTMGGNATAAASPKLRHRGNLSVANNDVIDLFPYGATVTSWALGYVFINHTSSGHGAILYLRGGGHQVIIVSQTAAEFTTTQGTAGKINVYWSAANNRYELQNLVGSTRGFDFTYLCR